jgi:HK97 family phage portal protein
VVWPFRRKAAAPPATKSAAFLLSSGLSNGSLTGAAYQKVSLEGYAQCVIAFDAINRVASAVASVEVQLYKKNRRTGKLDKIEVHPLLDLMQNPNPAQSGREFMAHLVSYHRVAGNAFVFGNGIDPNIMAPKPPREMQLLQPGKVTVKPGPALFPLAYEYKPTPSQEAVYPVNQITGKSAVLHLKTFNPLNCWSGLSPFDPAALGVDIHNDGQRWNKKLIENGARPSGALVVKADGDKPGMLTDEQYQRLQEMIDQQYTGAGNAGRPMLLEGGLDWKEMSLNPKDMEFLQGKHSAARDIALAFGVPPQLLGIPGDNTYSNYGEAKLAFWTDTVLPLLGQVLDGFNRWLTPLYGDDLFLWYDEETIPALEPLRKQKADRVNAATYLTLDEKRAAMGYDAYTSTGEPGGVILVPSTSIPIDMAGEIDLPEPGSPADEEQEEDKEE